MVSISCLAEVVTFLVNLLVGGNSNKSDPCHLSNNITPFLKKTILCSQQQKVQRVKDVPLLPHSRQLKLLRISKNSWTFVCVGFFLFP